MSEEKIAEVREAIRQTTEEATRSREAALAFLERTGIIQYMGPATDKPKRTRPKKAR